jgi:hypothetical protein
VTAARAASSFGRLVQKSACSTMLSQPRKSIRLTPRSAANLMGLWDRVATVAGLLVEVR